MNLHITGEHTIFFRLFVMYLLYLSILQKETLLLFFENMLKLFCQQKANNAFNTLLNSEEKERFTFMLPT